MKADVRGKSIILSLFQVLRERVSTIFPSVDNGWFAILSFCSGNMKELRSKRVLNSLIISKYTLSMHIRFVSISFAHFASILSCVRTYSCLLFEVFEIIV